MRAVLGMLLLGAGLTAGAQALDGDVPPQRALRLAQAPLQLDGRLDEAFWAQAPVHAQFFEFEPQAGRAAPWRTEVRLVVDDQALIFGIRAFDPAPQQIRATPVRRDQVKRDQDFVAVFLDPTGLQRHAQFVRVGAGGSLADGSYSAQDDNEDFSPDFGVQTAVQRLADGYSVELRWPLAQLRYPYEGGLPWRLMVARSVPREDNALWLSAPLGRDDLHFITRMQPIEGMDELIATVRDRQFLQLRPELTWRRQGQSEPGQASALQSQAQLGLALKWRPRADWVLDGSWRPDFSQVELDEPQLAGNTRYALFQQEKRPFFLESRDLTGQAQAEPGGSARGLAGFYSRAITDPRWGLRASWRGAEGAATVLHLLDQGGGQVLRPAAYATAQAPQDGPSRASFGRWQRELASGQLGWLASQRDYGGGRSNRVLGLDGQRSLGEQFSLRGQALLSSTSAGFDAHGQPLRQASQRGHYLWLEGKQRSPDWSHELQLERISPRFANDNGFVNQSGIQRLNWLAFRRLGALEMGLPGTPLQWPAHDFNWELLVEQTQTLSDRALAVPAGETVSRQIRPGLWFASERHFELWAHLNLDRQRVASGARLHAPRSATVGFTLNPLPWWSRLELEWTQGQRLDVEADQLGRGSLLALTSLMRWRLPGDAGLEWQQQLSGGRILAPEGPLAMKEWAAQSLLTLQLSAQDALRLILQSGGQARRLPQPLAAQRSQAWSLLYQQRRPGGQWLSLGCSQQRDTPQQARQWECFSKLSLELDA